MHARTHARTHACTHAHMRTHARTHTRSARTGARRAVCARPNADRFSRCTLTRQLELLQQRLMRQCHLYQPGTSCLPSTFRPTLNIASPRPPSAARRIHCSRPTICSAQPAATPQSGMTRRPLRTADHSLCGMSRRTARRDAVPLEAAALTGARESQARPSADTSPTDTETNKQTNKRAGRRELCGPSDAHAQAVRPRRRQTAVRKAARLLCFGERRVQI
jgi:hypothetical protein